MDRRGLVDPRNKVVRLDSYREGTCTDGVESHFQRG